MDELSQKKQAMIQGGEIISRVVKQLKPLFREGVKTIDIDTEAARLIKQEGGDISFNKVKGYKWATCISVNEVVVHGVPNQYKLRHGDIVKLDIGVYYGGYHVDYGDTYVVGEVSAEIKQFLRVGRETLSRILKKADEGVYINQISNIIQNAIYEAGYKVIHTLTGHAVGRNLHEDPLIPGVVMDSKLSEGPRLRRGTAYALEVIYSMNDENVHLVGNDGWSLATSKGSLSACFENTVFIDEEETIVLVK